jgi:hypothetical protein
LQSNQVMKTKSNNDSSVPLFETASEQSAEKLSLNKKWDIRSAAANFAYSYDGLRMIHT